MGVRYLVTRSKGSCPRCWLPCCTCCLAPPSWAVCVNHGSRERWLFTFLLSYTRILISKHSTVSHPLRCKCGTLVTLQREKCLSHIPKTNCCTAAHVLLLFYLWPTEGLAFFDYHFYMISFNILLIAVICGKQRQEIQAIFLTSL